MQDLKYLPIGQKTEITVNTLAAGSLIKCIIQSEGRKSAFSYISEGYSNLTLEDALKVLNKEGAYLVFKEHRQSENADVFIFGWKESQHSFLQIYTSKSDSYPDRYYMVQLYSDTEKVFEFCKEYFRSISIRTESDVGYVFSVVKNGHGGLQFSRLGLAGINLERDNYSKTVIDAYDFVTTDLKSSTPTGRIVILEGVPGSGKTFIVRGLLMDVRDAMFVIIPVATVSELAGPEFLPLLL